MKPTIGWHHSENDYSGIAVIAGFVGIVLLSVAEYSLCWAPFLFALLFIVVRAIILAVMGRSLYGFVLTDVSTASQVVENVLKDKGLTFIHNGYQYEIEGSSLYVSISAGRMGANGPQGTNITFQPLSEDNKPLINSLREKLDKAFLPRGLS